MVVTKIERQQRHRQRVNIFLDGEFAFGLHEEILLKAGIRVGDSLDPSTISIIKTHEEAKLATGNALRLISLRWRTERELRIALLEKEFAPSVVDNVIHDLQTKGIVDDRRFAEAYVRDSRLRRPMGPALLTQKLRLLGIERDLIAEALQSNLPGDAEAELAYATALKMLGRYRSSRKSVPPEKQEERVAHYLSQRGFRWETIRPVLKKVFSSPQGSE